MQYTQLFHRLFSSFRHPKQWSKKTIIFFFVTLVIFYINAFHEQYPDEFDNLLGGWYILHGVLPFSGFFSHHGPAAYFVSAFVQIFSWHSFVRFRVVYNAFLTIGIFIWYFYLRSRFGEKITSFYLYFAVLIGIAATYFWGQMLLADSLCGYLLGAVFIFFVLKYLYKEKFLVKDIIILSILISLALLTSLTYIYLCAIIYLFIIVAYYQDYRSSLKVINVAKVIGILAAPYIIFLLYLLVTGGLYDYVYQSVIFNEKYYIYNYPGLQNGHINPIRFAIVIAYTFFNNFYTLLLQFRSFNFNYPFNITLAVIDVSLLVYVFLRRNYSLFIFIVLFMIFANARSNPLSSGETDYQSSVYIVMSLLAMAFILPNLFNEIHVQISLGKKSILIGLFTICIIHSFFTVGFLTDKFLQKAYGKYMGTAPLIYDRPDPAVIINNAISSPNDYIWIGPLDFQDYYYMNGKLASKYHILIPGMRKSDKIQQEFLADMNAHQPKLIFLQKNDYILGSNPSVYGQYFIQFLNKDYTTLSQYKQGEYTSVISDSKFSLDGDMYINKNDADSIIAKLLSNNLVKPAYAAH